MYAGKTHSGADQCDQWEKILWLIMEKAWLSYHKASVEKKNDQDWVLLNWHWWPSAFIDSNGSTSTMKFSVQLSKYGYWIYFENVYRLRDFSNVLQNPKPFRMTFNESKMFSLPCSPEIALLSAWSYVGGSLSSLLSTAVNVLFGHLLGNVTLQGINSSKQTLRCLL